MEQVIHTRGIGHLPGFAFFMIIITLRLNFHAWHDPAVLGTISLEKSERKMLTDHSSTTCQDHLKAEVVLMPTYQVISVAHCGDR